ncbi:MAG: low affinity potassium transporter [Pleopsidium flavum]|nr:MAG: low affinity potassium transporter [Pleopsidium flavum]
MFGPWIEVWQWSKARIVRLVGSPFKKHRLNYITIHYLYILALAILGSILLYPAGGLAYIDSLFFASGSATQSGLNTVNINDITTYQQVILYIIPFVANPIFINTFVVFVRLYWFEKRFQNVVKSTTEWRRSRTRSRTVTENKADYDPGREERGVNGRNIVVLRSGGDTLGNGYISGSANAEKDIGDHVEESVSPSSSSIENKGSVESLDQGIKPPLPDSPLRAPSFHRDITFADEVKSPDTDTPESMHMPPQFSTEQHIAFLENQRNPKDKGTLRIPGPREFDRGDLPETVDGGQPDDQLDKMEEVSVLNSNDHAVKRNITIDEPNHPRSRTRTNTFPKFSLRRMGSSNQHPSLERPNSSAQMRRRSGTFSSNKSSQGREREREPAPYLSWQPTIGRNSAFVDLTEEQREELGGIEYRALKTLALVLVFRSGTYGPTVDSAGVSRVWWGIFTAPSLFNDLGFTLTPDSMISFQVAVFPLLLGTFLVIIGNTGFPCMLRFVIWTLSKIVPRDSAVWEEFKFLLDHPRRCFTLLFPSTATWWLFWILVILNGIDLVFYIVLDLHDPTVTSVPPGFRVLDGLFQAASTRTAGFAVVNLANLHPGIQVSYLIMMYISVFPIAISVRRTNVYEEKSLGIYGSKEEEAEDEKQPSYVGAHLRRQLSFDLWYIFLGFFIIALAEGGRLQNTNESAFTMFSVLFEIVSAYGTVGLSLGYPNIDASFSAEFTVISKLIIIAMQIRGRHRGLPYELDRAILLPSESLHKKEDQDAVQRMQRRGSNLSAQEAGGQAPFRPSTATTSGRETEGGSNSGSGKRHDHHVRGGLGRLMAGLAGKPKIDTADK